MSPIESPIAAGDRPEKPARRARCVLSERTAARKARLVAQLVNPTVVAEDVPLLTDQANSIYLAFKPRNGWQDWLTSTIATIMVRLNRCERVERKLRDYASYRAIDFWEDDQIVEVETLATKLDCDPTKVVAKLRSTPAGIDWLLKRWRILARVEPSDWTDEQRSLAGRLTAEDPTQPGFLADAIDELEALQRKVEDADAILRGLVEADLCDQKVPGLATLRRYSRSLHRQLKWYVDQFQVEHPDRWDDPMRKPAFEMGNTPSHTSTWSFADSESRTDETKPFAPVAADLEPEKTNPTTLPIADRENGETNPIERVEEGDNQPRNIPQLVSCQQVAAPGEQKGLDDSRRKRRVDPFQELARRREAAQRSQASLCHSAS